MFSYILSLLLFYEDLDCSLHEFPVSGFVVRCLYEIFIFVLKIQLLGGC